MEIEKYLEMKKSNKVDSIALQLDSYTQRPE